MGISGFISLGVLIASSLGSPLAHAQSEPAPVPVNPVAQDSVLQAHSPEHATRDSAPPTVEIPKAPLSLTAPLGQSGTWTSSCSSLPQDFSAKAETTVNTADKTLQTVLMIHSERNCTSPAIQVTYLAHYNVPQAGKLDITADRVEFRVLRYYLIDFYNKHDVCGLKNWKYGETKEVTGHSCFIFKMPKAGEKIFDTFKIEDGSLKFGKYPQVGGSSPKSRPKKFNGLLIYPTADFR